MKIGRRKVEQPFGRVWCGKALLPLICWLLHGFKVSYRGSTHSEPQGDECMTPGCGAGPEASRRVSPATVTTPPSRENSKKIGAESWYDS
jgi:hypothetical protein